MDIIGTLICKSLEQHQCGAVTAAVTECASAERRRWEAAFSKKLY